jgi:hypothetical protein
MSVDFRWIWIDFLWISIDTIWISIDFLLDPLILERTQPSNQRGTSINIERCIEEIDGS